MKIAFITNGWFIDEFRNFNYYQRVYFLSKGFDLTLYINKKAILNNEIKKSCHISRSSFGGKLGFLFYLLLKIKSIREFDVLIIEPSAFVVIGYITKLVFKTKLVIDIWDIPFRDLKNSLCTKIKRKLQVFFFRPMFHSADLYIVSILPEFQLKEFNLDESKMKCFMNAIHLDEFENLPDVELFNKFTILIQRSVFFKGFGLSLILDTLTELQKKIDIQLLIVGKMTSEAKQQINTHGMNENIILTGFIEHHKFVEIAKKSHVCVIPYPEITDLQQIYPIKAIEYLALGKPIVYTKIKGLARIIGDAGIPVYPINVENLAAKILEVYNNSNIRKQFETLAKSRAVDYDAAKKNSEIIDGLNKLISQ